MNDADSCLSRRAALAGLAVAFLLAALVLAIEFSGGQAAVKLSPVFGNHPPERGERP
ncbi:MAG: hypothetical protein P4L84_37270 [Isosphaeraceae bacterium]|nr:hypothetical protein [Isosphaeraceae bacterium]